MSCGVRVKYLMPFIKCTFSKIEKLNYVLNIENCNDNKFSSECQIKPSTSLLVILMKNIGQELLSS